ncbi:MAG: adenylosuccinate lyase [Eubacteriales bacterium]
MYDTYQNPLITRYASKEMGYLFSDDKKFRTWRRLWIALAESEMELGLSITKEQIDQMKKYKDDLNIEVAEEREKIVRHDVMSHVYAFSQQCDNAQGIIHLGATSCFVGDNTDIIVMDEALDLIIRRLVNVVDKLKNFADKYKSVPTLGFTHFQPAQLTTVGKRATLWMQELMMDLEELEHVKGCIKLRGVKGTTGTQDSFLALFDGDSKKVKELEKKVCQKMGYDKFFPVTGQTYPRKFDTLVINSLALIAQSAAKFANDLRLLQNLKEVEEPFSSKQIGSSAMAYKRNPMRSERINSLARFVISLASSPAQTASTQWLERTLDDSANKRLSIPQSFLAVDAILNIYNNIATDMVVYEKMIAKRVNSELPFMATERILMAAVQKGGDRQELHERIREHSMEAGRMVKVEGKENDLLDRIKADEAFASVKGDIDGIVDAKLFIGRCIEQVDEFIGEFVDPALSKYSSLLGDEGIVKV